jgi:tRNA (guanine-N7-)-methyltransferase
VKKYQNSREVDSPQTTIHENLEKVVLKNLSHEFQKPIAEHTQKAFELFLEFYDENKPLIMDYGCGVGESTQFLSQKYPKAQIVGIDRSELRLKKQDRKNLNDNPNILFLRADLIDFWRLLKQHNFQNKIKKHYLLYPNPSPKPGQLKRRFHAHPVFKDLLSLGGEFEVRSNWKIYLEEFAFAYELITKRPIKISQITDPEPISLFEKKYHESDQCLWIATSH